MPSTAAAETKSNQTLALYERYCALAAEIPARGVIPCRADVELAGHNARAGVQAILAQRPALDARIGEIPWEQLEEIPALADALSHAARRVAEGDGDEVETAGEMAQDLMVHFDEAWELRGQLLCYLEAAAAAGLLPADKVATIRAGTGRVDAATDLVECAALFERFPQAQAKTPVTPQQLRRAGDLGSKLKKLLTPAKGYRSAKAEKAAVLARDRLWTLLLTRYTEVRRLAMWLWMDRAGEHVRPLQARRVRKGRKAKA